MNHQMMNSQSNYFLVSYNQESHKIWWLYQHQHWLKLVFFMLPHWLVMISNVFILKVVLWVFVPVRDILLQFKYVEIFEVWFICIPNIGIVLITFVLIINYFVLFIFVEIHISHCGFIFSTTILLGTTTSNQNNCFSRFIFPNLLQRGIK